MVNEAKHLLDIALEPVWITRFDHIHSGDCCPLDEGESRIYVWGVEERGRTTSSVRVLRYASYNNIYKYFPTESRLNRGEKLIEMNRYLSIPVHDKKTSRALVEITDLRRTLHCFYSLVTPHLPCARSDWFLPKRSHSRGMYAPHVRQSIEVNR